MPQLTLYDASEVVLTDDERGKVSYSPAFIDRDTAGWRRFRDLPLIPPRQDALPGDRTRW